MKRSQINAFLSFINAFVRIALLIVLFSPAPMGAADFAKHSKAEDFLYASSQKILLNWNGQIAAAALEALVTSHDEAQSDRSPISAEIFERSLHPKRRNDYSSTGNTVRDIGPVSPENPKKPENLIVTGFVCFKSGVLMIFEPQSYDLAESSLYFTAEKIFGGAQRSNPQKDELGLRRSDITQIVSCSLNSKGELLVMHEDSQGLHLGFPLNKAANTNPTVPQRLYSSSGTAGETLILGVLEDNDQVKPDVWALVSKEKQSVELFDESLQTIARFTGFNFSKDSKLVIRGKQVLTSTEGSAMLSIYDFKSIRFKTQRLQISPCDDDLTCAVSLGSDESWAVSGYWGTYLGTHQEFKRIPLRNFSRQGLPLVFSHSALRGKFAVFGADDSDMGSLEKLGYSAKQTRQINESTDENLLDALRAAAEAHHQHTEAQPVSGYSVAWLKRHAQRAPGEHALFEVANTTLVLTPFAFDPKRFAAFEANRQLPALDTNRFLPFHDAPGNWWKAATDLSKSVALLETKGIEPQPVRIALLDSGADFSHPDFHPKTAALSAQPDFDFVDLDHDPTDLFGHGTHVSGLAKPYDPAFSRLFKNIELLTVRVLNEFGKSNTIDIGMGFLYAADKKSDIINASWGGGARTQFMEDSILYAYERGALVITSAGNDGLNLDVLNPEPAPGGFKGVISIAATQNRGSSFRRAPFSNYGRDRVFGFAPGANISSLKLGGGFVDMSGTSMAAPLASAMFAVALGVWRIENAGSAWKEKIQDAFCSRRSEDQLAKDSRCGALNLLDALDSLSATSLAHKVTDDIRFASQTEHTERRANEWQN